MKLQRSTGVLLGVAIALLSAVTVLETQKGNNNQDDSTLYGFAEADVSSLKIDIDNNTLAFSKTDDEWEMTAPESAPADPSSIAFLLNLLTTSAIKETISTTPDDLSVYGLDDPTAIVELTTLNEESHTLLVGEQDFNNTSLYVTKFESEDNPQTVNIHLISNDLENGLERPLEDWLLNEEANEETEDDTNISEE